MSKTAAIQVINVYYEGFGERQLVGQLTRDGAGSRSRPVFSYDATWISNGHDLSPIEMPRQPALYRGRQQSAYYLPGLLADSLPDGWGMLLMDRFFRQTFTTPIERISALERLAYIGDSAMGALTFEPQYEPATAPVECSMASLARANQAILSGQDSDILAELIVIGGSPQGAKPKALVLFDPHSQFISTDQTLTHPTATPWLVKFPAQAEPKSICLLEFLYADMAKLAGLTMPAHHYFDIDDTHSAFAVERFDRQDRQRIHIHTLAGLLDIDFRTPSIDYLQYLRCVRMLTGSQAQVEKAYCHAVFNVIFNNKDDHSKNFSFMMNRAGQWQISPVYDLSYNTGMNGYHQMDVCGEALKPNYADLTRLAKLADIKSVKAKAIIEQVVTTAQQFVTLLDDHPIEANLHQQVVIDIKANIERMRCGSGSVD